MNMDDYICLAEICQKNESHYKKILKYASSQVDDEERIALFGEMRVILTAIGKFKIIPQQPPMQIGSFIMLSFIPSIEFEKDLEKASWKGVLSLNPNKIDTLKASFVFEDFDVEVKRAEIEASSRSVELKAKANSVSEEMTTHTRLLIPIRAREAKYKKLIEEINRKETTIKIEKIVQEGPFTIDIYPAGEKVKIPLQDLYVHKDDKEKIEKFLDIKQKSSESHINLSTIKKGASAPIKTRLTPNEKILEALKVICRRVKNQNIISLQSFLTKVLKIIQEKSLPETNVFYKNGKRKKICGDNWVSIQAEAWLSKQIEEAEARSSSDNQSIFP